MKSFIKICAIVFLVCGVMAPAATNAQFFFFENPNLGKKAPDFSLPTTKGEEMSLSGYRDGNSAIIFFWATWCPHCRVQLNELNNKKSELEGKGIKIVLVDIEESAETVRHYLKSNNIGYPVFLDKNSAVAEEYAIVGVPTFFYLNKDGVVRAVEHEIVGNYEEILLGG